MLTILRTILDKLIYFDSYEKIDSEMSDSNIGGRKNKNIENHIFTVNAIVNEVKNDKNLCVDMELLDISKCFDSLWVDEVMNDMYDICETNDKLSLVYEENRKSYVAINTPFGLMYSQLEMLLKILKCRGVYRLILSERNVYKKMKMYFIIKNLYQCLHYLLLMT